MSLDDALVLAAQVLADYEAPGADPGPAPGAGSHDPARQAGADITGYPRRCVMTALARALADLEAARDRLALLRAEHAALLAAARATVAAAQSGEADPAGYVRGVLEDRGQLAPAGARPLHVMADARSALCLTGWSA